MVVCLSIDCGSPEEGDGERRGDRERERDIDLALERWERGGRGDGERDIVPRRVEGKMGGPRSRPHISI